MSTCACLSQPDLVPSLPSLKQKQAKKQNMQGNFHLLDESVQAKCFIFVKAKRPDVINLLTCLCQAK